MCGSVGEKETEFIHGEKTYSMLNKLWRIGATGLSFLVFGILGLVYLPVALFLYLTRSREEMERVTQKLTSKAFRFFLWFMKFVGVVSHVKYQNFEQFDGNEAKIIVANHPTLIDVIAVVSYFDQMDCLVKQGVWKNPLLAVSVRASGYISEEGPVQVFEECRDRLDRGRSVFIFPEGTRSPKDEIGSFSRLPAQLSLVSGKRIYPLTIEYNYSTLRSDQSWYNVPPEPLELTIRAYDPVTPPPMDEESLKIQSEHLTRELKDFYQKELSFLELDDD